MEKENKIPGPPVGYTDLLDYELTQSKKKEREAYKDGTKKRYFPLRPSSAGYCAKRLAQDLMEYHGYEEYERKVDPPPLQRLFKLGYSVEYATLQMFNMVKLVKVKYKQQVLTCFKLKDGTLIEGSCDDCLISDEWKAVMDVKSTKDGFSVAYKSRWDNTLAKFDQMKTLTKISETAWYVDDIRAFMKEHGDDFLFDNIYQLNVYACTNFMKERGIDHCVIYKYNKNDSRHYELRFCPDQSLADEVEEKFNTIVEAVATKDISKIKSTCKLGTMRAAFCPCRGFTDEAKKAWFASFPKKTWPTKMPTKALGAAFKNYEALLEEVNKKEALAIEIVNELVDKKIQKIRLDNDHIYELKYLKTPKNHFELRRSKA